LAPRREGHPPFFFGGENPVDGRLENRFLAPSRNKFFTPEHSGNAGVYGEGGGESGERDRGIGDGGRRSIWRRRRGGGFRDMVFFAYFLVAPMPIFFGEREGK